MAHRATTLGDNRFALLATSSPKDKKRKTIRYLTPLSNPKYVVVSSKDENKPLSNFSCFAVERSVHIISKDIISVWELRDGSLLLLVENKTVAQKFISAKQLAGLCEIRCKYHENLNFVKGTIYAPYLSHVPEEEIVKNLESQGVVSVYKFKKFDDKSKNSGVILLTFDLYNLPQSINISWHKAQIREYIPNPMRCKMCQLLGHTTKYCKKDPVCVNCSLPTHGSDVCVRTKCANCEEEHPSNSNKCTKFIQQKEILRIKTQQKCTLKQARAKYVAQLPQTSSPSYFSGVTAQAARTNPTNSSPLTSTMPITTTARQINKNSFIANTNSSPLTSAMPITTTTRQTNNISSISNTTQKDSNSITLSTMSTIRERIPPEPTRNTTTISEATETFPMTTTSKEASAAHPKLQFSVSPITSLTRQLLENNDYYTTNLVSSDSDADITK